MACRREIAIAEQYCDISTLLHFYADFKKEILSELGSAIGVPSPVAERLAPLVRRSFRPISCGDDLTAWSNFD